jgi:hypothetical protein
MGYTQFLKNPAGFTDEQWDRFTAEVKKIFEKAEQRGIVLANHYGDIGTKPVITKTKVSFNGFGDDAHETCQVTKKGEDFSFCKTARKPYDWAVVEVYKLVKRIVPSAVITSDGGDSVFLDNESAFDLIKKSDILEVDGYHLSNWELDETAEDEDPVLTFSYSDFEGAQSLFEFSADKFENVEINGNEIVLEDDVGDKVKITCWKLTSVSA